MDDYMYLSIGDAAEFLGVSVSTLRRWEKEGFLTTDFKTKGHLRRNELDSLEAKFDINLSLRGVHAVAYERVSRHDQKEDLSRQRIKLEAICQDNFLSFERIEDLGSGLNYKKAGLKKLLRLIFSRKVTHLIIDHKDRLPRFGSELVFDLCKHFDVAMVILEDQVNPSFEVEFTRDVIEPMTVFSSRLYGRKSYQNRSKRMAA